MVEEKKCSACKTIKPLEDFWKGCGKGGKAPVCIICAKEKAAVYRDKNRIRLREASRLRAHWPSKKEKKAVWSQRPDVQERRKATQKKWRQNNRVKARAHMQVEYEIRQGRIVKQNCEVCGEENAQAHHDDYTKPKEVRWLCSTHHAEWHRFNKARV